MQTVPALNPLIPLAIWAAAFLACAAILAILRRNSL